MKYDFQSFVGGVVFLWFFIQVLAIAYGEINLLNRDLGIKTVGFNVFNVTYLILSVIICVSQLWQLFK